MDALREQPSASSSVADVCRRSWNRHSGRPAFLNNPAQP
jgi:hypothetical protein